MFGLINVSTLFLSVVMIPGSLGLPPSLPIVDPVLCAVQCGAISIPFPCGLPFAVQAHNFLRTNADPYFYSLNIPYFYTAPPMESSVLGLPLPPLGLLTETGFTKRIGWVSSESPTIYNGLFPVKPEGLAINHRSYFVPPSTGTYTFTASEFDDGLFMWIGENAFNDKYTRGNANIDRTLGDPVAEFTISLVAGNYYPFRVLFVNGAAYAGFRFSITSPDGKVLFNDRDSHTTEYFVPHGCGAASPAFRAFGKETAAT